MTTTKPNTGFWIIAVLALLWNLMGVFQYLSTTLWADAIKEALPPEQVALMDALPSWYSYVFAVAVFAGVIGSLLLLIRNIPSRCIGADGLLVIRNRRDGSCGNVVGSYATGCDHYRDLPVFLLEGSRSERMVTID